MSVSNRPRRERISKETRAFVFQRDGYRCWLCGKVRRPFDLTCDHIKPSSHGGTGLISNLVTACKTCNSKRQAPHPNADGKYR